MMDDPQHCLETEGKHRASITAWLVLHFRNIKKIQQILVHAVGSSRNSILKKYYFT